jgi:hypothetical protein
VTSESVRNRAVMMMVMMIVALVVVLVTVLTVSEATPAPQVLRTMPVPYL